MKLTTLIMTILATAAITSSRATTIEAFDATSALLEHYKDAQPSIKGVYSLCGVLTPNEIKKILLKSPLKQINSTSFIFLNGDLCTVSRTSDPISESSDFKVEVQGSAGNLDSNVSLMKDQGIVYFSTVGSDMFHPKIYLIKIKEL